MPKIFISYRREDSAHQADRIHHALRKVVPDPKNDIFIDIDNIPVGVDFVQHLDSKVAQCDVLLALIGPDWLGVRNPKTGERRLDDPKDFVRIEIASALKRGVAVAPVLLDGAAFPAEEDLPDDLKPLVRRNGIEVRRTTFDTDADRLIRGLDLERLGGASPKAASGGKVARAQDRKTAGGWVAPTIVALLVVMTGGGAWMWTAHPFGLFAQAPADTPGGAATGTLNSSTTGPATPSSDSASAAEAAKVAAPLLGKWAGTGLTCQDAVTISVSEGNLVLAYGNAPSSEKIEGAEPDGSIRTRSNAGTIFYQVNGQSLSIRAPDGSTGAFTRC